MATTKSRLERLEALTPSTVMHHCIVTHGEDCAKDCQVAEAAYRAKHGCEPTKFIHVLLISVQTKQSICGCSLSDDREGESDDVESNRN